MMNVKINRPIPVILEDILEQLKKMNTECTKTNTLPITDKKIEYRDAHDIETAEKPKTAGRKGKAGKKGPEAESL